MGVTVGGSVAVKTPDWLPGAFDTSVSVGEGVSKDSVSVGEGLDDGLGDALGLAGVAVSGSVGV